MDNGLVYNFQPPLQRFDVLKEKPVMKKLLPLLLVAIVIVGSYKYFASQTSESPSSTPPGQSSVESKETRSEPVSSGSTTVQIDPARLNAPKSGSQSVESGNDESPEEQVKPAAEAYASAEEAISAVLKGAKEYDDSILEQFTLPDANCSWCSEFYTSVRDLAVNPNTPQEQRAYLAEILAISGRVDNVQTLVESIKNAQSNDAADLYAEALELTLGKDDVVSYLGDQMNASNETLREASVAAITNQGTKQAAELLVKNLKERGDPEGYYSIGIGLGEFIPDEEAMPVVQGLVRERGPEAHLGVKALLNAGLPGVQILFDELKNSSNVEADKALLKDAADHINIEDDVIALAKEEIALNRNQNTAALGQMIQELAQSAEQPEEGEGDGEGEQYQTLAQ